MSGHGYTAYTRKKDPCRCEVCRAAKAAYQREKRAAAAKPDLPRLNRFRVGEYPRPVAQGVTHGTAHAYNDNGCRCLACTEAANAKRLREYHTQQARRKATS